MPLFYAGRMKGTLDLQQGRGEPHLFRNGNHFDWSLRDGRLRISGLEKAGHMGRYPHSRTMFGTSRETMKSKTPS